MEDIKPASALFTGIPGALMLVGVPYLRGWVRDAFLFVGVILACFAVTILFFWARDMWIDQNIRIWNAKDRIYMLAQEAAHLNADQIRFAEQSSHLGIDVGTDGTKYLRGTDAPLEWVSEFLGKSYNRRLFPVRNYSAGSIEHEYADQVTNAFINAGFALCAIGNQSAPLAAGVTPEIIAKKIGINLPPPPGDYTPSG